MPKEYPKTLDQLLAISETEDPELKILTKGYLFHGSPNGEIKTLTPKQCSHSGEPDGAPAVCATDSLWNAMFKAIVNSAPLTNKKPYSRSGWSHNDLADLSYYATKNLLSAAESATGYLYLLSPDNFQWIDLPTKDKKRPRRELRSLKPVTPLTRIPVTLSDFPYPIEESQ